MDNRRKIVMFRGTPVQSVVDQLKGAGITVLDDLPLINALVVQLPSLTLLGIDPALALLQTLSNLGVVLEVVDDLLTFIDPICPTTALPPLTPAGYRWGPQQIEVPAVDQQWPTIKGLADVTVAVLDTGIAFHPDLSGRTAPGYNAITGGGQPVDGHGHGTHMAGIIAADKDLLGITGVAGVEPRIKVAAVKVLDDNGAGYLSVVIKGLEWVLNNDIPLVNMSFGFSTESDTTPLKQAIQRLSKADIIMVASAGNRCTAGGASEDGGGDDDCGPAATCNSPLTAITAPAAYSGVLAVGATDFDGQTPAYSLSGSKLAVKAPGGAPDSGAPDNGQILSTNAGGIYGRGHGTSQAAAHVTGAIALALSLEPGLTSAEVRDLVRQTAVAGRIDVKNMIEALLP
jgi:subtilisin family serine protease